MAINFPNSPSDGEIFGNYTYDDSIPGWRKTPENSASLPAGTIVQWPGATAPANWLICDGAAVSRTEYASLFAAIGVQYGAGNGTTTFNLPNLKGRVAVGFDASQSEFDVLGEVGGAKTHTLTVSEMPVHSHANTATVSITGGAHTHNLPMGASGAPSGVNDTPLRSSGGPDGNFRTGFESSGSNYGSSTGTHTHSGTITMSNANAGSGSAHNNLQPYIVLNYIIKTSAGITSGDSELATRVGAAETKANTVPLSPNMIINSDMSVTQRGTTFTFGTGGGGRYWPADRFNVEDYTWSAGSNITVSNDTSVVPSGIGVLNSIKVATGATGLTFNSGGMIRIQYSVEGVDMSRLYGKKTMLSFYVRSNLAGTYNMWLANGDFGTGAFTRAYTPEFAITQADTWQRVSIPLDFTTITSSSTWNTTNSVGLQIFWVLGAHADRTGDVYKSDWTAVSGYGAKTTTSVNWATGSNRTFYITGVQLEEGTNTTPYRRNHDNVQAAIASCQRYFIRMYDPPLRGVVGSPGSNINRIGMVLPVAMRAAPSVSFGGTLLVWDGSNSASISSIGSLYPQTTSVEYDFTMSNSSYTTGRAAALYKGGNGYFDWSAEL